MNPENNPLPDYYAILQVHPEAETDVIRAAYRMLMRKYHPDSLSPAQRQDIELITRVRLINLAYDTLSDPAQRAAYDVAFKQQREKPPVLSTPGLEMRIHLVRCAKMSKTYKMLLARRVGSVGLFRVTGFELIEDPTPVRQSGELDGSPRLLPDGRDRPKSLGALLKSVWPNTKKHTTFDNKPPKFPDQSALNDIFITSDTLSFSEIDWAGYNCPSCQTEFPFLDGQNASWCHCSSCSRIYCAGNLHHTPLGVYGQCPWCGRIVKISRRLQPGEHIDAPVRGEVGRSAGEFPKMKGAERKRLPDKNDG
jgi:hypothetical protein